MLTAILISSYALITVGVFLLPSFLTEDNSQPMRDRSFEGRLFGAVLWPFLPILLTFMVLTLLANFISDWTDRRLERRAKAQHQLVAAEQEKQAKLLNQALPIVAANVLARMQEETDYRHAHCQSCGQVKK